MSKLLLEGGRIVDPSRGFDRVADLLIDGDRIAAIGDDLDAAGAEVIDAAGLVVAPGFIDMHVHLREPGHEYKETVATGTAAAAAGGFTGVACMPNTVPVNDNRAVTELITERAEEAGAVPVYPIGCVSVGQQGEALAEIGELVAGGCVAVSDDGYPVATAELMRRALEYTQMFGVPVIEHCEDLSLSRKAPMNEGQVSTALGLKGHPTAAEDIIVARDIALAELTGGRLHCAHVSSGGAVRMIRDAKARGVDVTCEVTPHHFTLTDEAVRTFDTNTKMNPPLRAQTDVDAIREGLADGTIDAIASDHAPHHADEKALEFDLAPFGIVGLETAVPLAIDRLLHGGHVPLSRLVELLAVNPARILGLDRDGLVVGAAAHVTVLDLERVAKVDVAGFASKGRNTPFDGWELKGWPVLTIVAGKVVWKAREAAARR
jgi:dihydroorotase